MAMTRCKLMSAYSPKTFQLRNFRSAVLQAIRPKSYSQEFAEVLAYPIKIGCCRAYPGMTFWEKSNDNEAR